MVTNWVKVLFSSTDKLFDILNVGRLVFYSMGGLLAVYPLVLIAGLLTREQVPAGGLFASIEPAPIDSWMLFFLVLVAGFVLALVSFHLLTAPAYRKGLKALGAQSVNELSFNYQYPFLRNDPDQDYQSWLIAEYFRYVEIATIIPLGLIAGLCASALYAVLYLVHFGPAALAFSQINSALGFLVVIAAVLALLVHWVWPYFWRPLTVSPNTVEVTLPAASAVGAGPGDADVDLVVRTRGGETRGRFAYRGLGVDDGSEIALTGGWQELPGTGFAPGTVVELGASVLRSVWVDDSTLLVEWPDRKAGEKSGVVKRPDGARCPFSVDYK